MERALRRTFWQVYDNLGLVFIVSVLWIPFSLTLILLPQATAALFYIARQITLDKSVYLKDFFKAMRENFIKNTVVFLSFAILCIIFFADMKFYMKNFGTLGILLAGINFWFLFFSILAFLYALPLLSRTKGYTSPALSKERAVVKIFKYSYLLALTNIKTSLILLLFSLVFIFIEIVLPIIGIGMLAVFTQNMLLETEAKYDKKIQIPEHKRKLNELWKVWE